MRRVTGRLWTVAAAVALAACGGATSGEVVDAVIGGDADAEVKEDDASGLDVAPDGAESDADVAEDVDAKDADGGEIDAGCPQWAVPVGPSGFCHDAACPAGHEGSPIGGGCCECVELHCDPPGPEACPEGWGPYWPGDPIEYCTAWFCKAPQVEKTCVDGAECVVCHVPPVVTSTAQCSCQTCYAEPTTAAECALREVGWAHYCGPGAWAGADQCPDVACEAPPSTAAMCGEAGLCVYDLCALVDCAEPECPPEERIVTPGACCPTCPPKDTCETDADCANCLYPTAPESTDGCYCPMCPNHTMTVWECSANAEAHQQFCNGQVWPEGNDCVMPPCAPPPEPGCDAESGQCVFGAGEGFGK